MKIKDLVKVGAKVVAGTSLLCALVAGECAKDSVVGETNSNLKPTECMDAEFVCTDAFFAEGDHCSQSNVLGPITVTERVVVDGEPKMVKRVEEVYDEYGNPFKTIQSGMERTTKVEAHTIVIEDGEYITF